MTEGNTRGWPGVGGFSASLSDDMSSASPNRSSATVAFAVYQDGGGGVSRCKKKHLYA